MKAEEARKISAMADLLRELDRIYSKVEAQARKPGGHSRIEYVVPTALDVHALMHLIEKDGYEVHSINLRALRISWGR